MSNVILDVFGVTSLSDIRDNDPMVSSVSRWSDDVWIFDVDAPGYSARKLGMSWRIDAPSRAVEQMKYLAALLYVRRAGEPPLKNTGAAHTAIGMRHLLHFMRKHSMTTLAELDQASFEIFKSEIGRQLSDPVEAAKTEEQDSSEHRQALNHRAGDSAVDKSHDETSDWMFVPDASQQPARSGDQQEISTSVAYTRLIVWRQIRDHASELRNAGIVIPQFDPFRGTSVKKVAEALAAIATGSIPPIPDLVAKPILEVAHGLMAAPADDVIRLHDEFMSERARLVEGESAGDRIRRLNRLVMEFDFTPVAKNGVPWRSVTDALRWTDGAATVRSLVTLIRDAAVIVLQSDTGMRISEICSVSVDDTDDDSALPSCISVGTSNTQLNEHFFVHGRLSKGVRKPRSEKWLIGGRPCGSSVEPPSARALRVLTRLLRPWRRLAEDAGLAKQLLPAAVDCWLPSEPRHIGETIGYALTRSMQNFIEREVNLKERLGHLVHANPEIRSYVDENGRCIRAHQWRKTFLRYLIRVDEDLLPAISAHFKHYTLAITEDGYMPKDPEMFENAESVRTRETSRALYKRRFGKAMPLSQLDGLLAESRKRIEEVIGGEPFEHAAPRLDEFVREHDLQFWFASHGGCMIDLNPEHARCHQQTGTGDWKPRSPDFATRSPETCLGCRNFSAGPESIGFWRKRYIANQTSWVESGYKPQFRVARKRATQSAVVLRHLRQPLPLILARAPGRSKFNYQKENADG